MFYYMARLVSTMNQLLCSDWVTKQTRWEVSLTHLVLFGSFRNKVVSCMLYTCNKSFIDQACSYRRA